MKKATMFPKNRKKKIIFSLVAECFYIKWTPIKFLKNDTKDNNIYQKNFLVTVLIWIFFVILLMIILTVKSYDLLVFYHRHNKNVK